MAKIGQDWDQWEICRAKRSVSMPLKSAAFIAGNWALARYQKELIQHGLIWVTAT